MTYLEELLASWLAMTSVDDSVIAFLKATVLSQWVLDTPWAWPTLEIFHFIGMTLLVGIIGPLDIRLLGYMKRVPIAALKELVPWAIVGFTLNLITGALFLIAVPDQYIGNVSWWFKVLFLIVAGLNMLTFEMMQRPRIRAMAPGADTPTVFKVIGGVSLFSWFMVLYWGRMLPFLGTAF